MRNSYFLFIISLCSLFGCAKEQINPDYKSVIIQLQKNDFYKQCVGHYIVQRSRENQYFYMSDTLIGPVFFVKGGKAVTTDDHMKEMYEGLKKKSVPNIEKHIKETERKASAIIPFMRKNGIAAVDGKQENLGKEHILLEIYLENGYILFLVKQDFDRVKEFKSESYEYVDRIDDWLIMKDRVKYTQ